MKFPKNTCFLVLLCAANYACILDYKINNPYIKLKNYTDAVFHVKNVYFQQENNYNVAYVDYKVTFNSTTINHTKSSLVHRDIVASKFIGRSVPGIITMNDGEYETLVGFNIKTYENYYNFGYVENLIAVIVTFNMMIFVLSYLMYLLSLKCHGE
jgi:hypothetical protein